MNMGNPHAVIVVEDVQTAPVAHWGEAIESHEQFPERVNVGFMQIVDRESIRLRVFERTQYNRHRKLCPVFFQKRLFLVNENHQTT